MNTDVNNLAIYARVINKILTCKESEFLKDVDLRMFEKADEKSILVKLKDYLDKYNIVMDKDAFLLEYPKWNFVEVDDPNEAILESLNEQYVYNQILPIYNNFKEIIKTNSVEALDYLKSSLESIENSSVITGTNLITEANLRYEEYVNKKLNNDWYIPTGFKELDNIIHGLNRGEEFAVLFARTGIGKSFIALSICLNACKLGHRVGYVSPEMSPSMLGFRTDSLDEHFSSSALMRGKEVPGYKEYIDKLMSSNYYFMAAEQKDFNNVITVSKLRRFVTLNQLDFLCIDGLTYLTDERGSKRDNKTTVLTNISQDLMQLSIQLKIPILAIVQSNREGVKEDAPSLENIRDSDGISHNASKVISLKQNDMGGIEIVILKHRAGTNGGRLLYLWDIDKGIFTYVVSENDATTKQEKQENIAALNDKFEDFDVRDF